MTGEVDRRIALMSTLTKVPHGDLNKAWAIHSPEVKSDPYFYERLATWMIRESDIPRDLKVVAIAALFESNDEECRKTAAGLLWEIEPYMIYRVVRFIVGYHEKPKSARLRPKPPKGQTLPKAKKTEVIGRFNKNPSRYLKTEVTKILRSLEKNHYRWDRFFLNDREALEGLYTLLHIKPSEYAQASLFKQKTPNGRVYNPPAESVAWAIQQLNFELSNEEKLELIAKYSIPDKVASSFGIPITPAALGVMVDNMTPNGVVERVDWFKSVGAYDIPEVKKAIIAKINAAKTSERVSTGRMYTKETVADTEVAAAVTNVQAERIRKITRLFGDTLFAVDVSGSMLMHLPDVVLLAAQIAQAGENVITAFFSVETRVFSTVPSSVDEARRVLGTSVNSMTSYGSPIAYLNRKGLAVARVIFVGDGVENEFPRFIDEMRKYLKNHAAPVVTIIKPPGTYNRVIEDSCRQLGLDVTVWDWQKDDTGLSALLQVLSRKTAYDLYQEIIDLVPPRPR